ncbi:MULTISPECIES: DMT family transporter [Brevibacillus]|uniref:Multidrug transporter n=1 Tax=Brevibacillus parabrevis TaxID=54914 RepID=A0A4Y3PHK8_BREPA|nr:MULTISPECIES: DMT family transporter [Brevibacillus]MED2256967.1 DMT family transporter [Brevibacillus parabrevis]NRQ56553.1 EamA family transporter [Brevibacillus sp. HD1.4A]RNB93281.1 EamA family transporter [Brevibacillus parabrevis]GEB33982.1 multidrug transporter [Brevibacillus parabrevis]
MKYILLVFLGACSYGILSTIVKLAYGQGYSPAEVIGGQMFFGLVLTWIPALFFLRTKPGKKQLLLLVSVGLAIGSTGILYYNALRFIPASIAIVLLFQFTWMGVLAEAIMTKQMPDKPTLLSLVLLLFGTLLAGGIFETDGIAQFHIAGVVLGLLSAVSYTMFLLFSGKAAIGVNPWVRSASMSTGSFLLAGLVYTPVFLWNGALLDGLFPYVFLLAFFGIFIPTVFFNFGVPHTGPGMAAILGAAELPMAVFSSFIILGETVSALQVTGVVVILLGMILPEWLRQRHKRLKSSLS